MGLRDKLKERRLRRAMKKGVEKDTHAKEKRELDALKSDLEQKAYDRLLKKKLTKEATEKARVKVHGKEKGKPTEKRKLKVRKPTINRVLKKVSGAKSTPSKPGRGMGMNPTGLFREDRKRGKGLL